MGTILSNSATTVWTKEEKTKLQKQLTDSQKAKTPPAGTPIMSVAESGNSPVHVLVRGNPHAPGKQVSPTIPAALRIPSPEMPETRPAGGTSGKRLALAKWLVSKNNPLTARVFVNRLWQFHFGRGIVPTPNDFGKFGEAFELFKFFGLGSNFRNSILPRLLELR